MSHLQDAIDKPKHLPAEAHPEILKATKGLK